MQGLGSHHSASHFQQHLASFHWKISKGTEEVTPLNVPVTLKVTTYTKVMSLVLLISKGSSVMASSCVRKADAAHPQPLLAPPPGVLVRRSSGLVPAIRKGWSFSDAGISPPPTI